MKKILVLAICLSSALTLPLLGGGRSLWAESTEPKPSADSVAIPFNPERDGKAFRPDDMGQSDRPYSDKDRAIIGEDDRQPVLKLDYPYSAIGRLDWKLSNGYVQHWCTGTLIGPNLVLTNSHCLTHPEIEQLVDSSRYIADSNRRLGRLIFKPGMIRGTAQDEATVVSYEYGWKSNQGNPGDDWALLRLDKPLGDEFGYLGWRSLDFSNPLVLQEAQGKLKMVGYAGDFPTEEFK